MDTIEQELTQLHPLLIDTVFRAVAKYLSFDELLEYTTVCKDWLLMIDTILCSLPGCSNPDPKNISDVYKSMTLSENWAAIMLGNVDFDTTPEIFKAFKHRSCLQMSSVYLSNCWLSQESMVHFLKEFGQNWEVIDFNLNKANPNEILSFPYPIYKDDKEEELLKLTKVRKFSLISKLYIIHWYSIANVFPNLVELTLVTLFFPPAKPVAINEQLQCLRKLIFSVPKSFECAWDSQLCILMGMKLKLVDLSLMDISKETNLNCVRMFLVSLKETLKYLSISSAISSTDDANFNEVKSRLFEWPVLPKLIWLRLDDVFFKNASILYSVPNVEILGCNFKTAEKWAEIIRRKKIPQSFSNVKKVFISIIGPKYLIRMAKFLPNMEYLRLNNCSDELLAILCKEFTGLKGIRLTGKMTDSGFLGISQEEPNKNLDEHNNDLVNQLLAGCPSITSFKDLEHLTIVALSGSSVTEKTVRHGLLTLPKLKTLLVFGLKISTELKKMFNAAGFKPYQLTKIFSRRTSQDTRAFGFVRYDKPLTIDERHNIYNEASKMLYVFENDKAGNKIERFE